MHEKNIFLYIVPASRWVLPRLPVHRPQTVKDGRITLSVGPDIVAKKKHTYSIVDKNAGKYIAQIEKELNQ